MQTYSTPAVVWANFSQKLSSVQMMKACFTIILGIIRQFNEYGEYWLKNGFSASDFFPWSGIFRGISILCWWNLNSHHAKQNVCQLYSTIVLGGCISWKTKSNRSCWISGQSWTSFDWPPPAWLMWTVIPFKLFESFCVDVMHQFLFDDVGRTGST